MIITFGKLPDIGQCTHITPEKENTTNAPFPLCYILSYGEELLYEMSGHILLCTHNTHTENVEKEEKTTDRLYTLRDL